MTKPYSLLEQRWLPVRRKSGAREWMAPHQITSNFADPIIRPEWCRADFDAATLEFLIGLIATACPPEDDEAWFDGFDTPPSPDELRERFAPLSVAFNLDGDGARFMQEYGVVDAEPSPIAGVFIEAPGANTEKNNTDLFQKRGRFEQIGLPAAAIALFTLQTAAPAGGAGHRTSLRGGGPLTTLALPPEDKYSLWHQLWLNVPAGEVTLPSDLSRIFPWLAPTITSEGKKPPIGADDIDQRGALWGMPRRIQLEIETVTEPVRCDVTGVEATTRVNTYRTRPWGMNFGMIAHPLSPMYRVKPNSAEWLYVHPQPGGLSYRHWIDMAAAESGEDSMRRAAPAVLAARRRLQALRVGRARLWAAGYDMDNMKARGFVEATFPLFALAGVDEAASRKANGSLNGEARAWVNAAKEVASLVTGALKDALEIEAADASQLGSVREIFFACTQDAFFAALDRLADGLMKDAGEEARITEASTFLTETLRPEALRIFDLHAPLLRPEAREAARIIKARLDLVSALLGYSTRGDGLFKILALPPPEDRSARKKRGIA